MHWVVGCYFHQDQRPVPQGMTGLCRMSSLQQFNGEKLESTKGACLAGRCDNAQLSASKLPSFDDFGALSA